MEMCYDGALVMPGSFAVMSEEEMTYVEGGIKAQRYMKAGDAEKELAANAAIYGAAGTGAGIGGLALGLTGLGIGVFLVAGGASAISNQMYSAWRQAKAIRKKYGKSRRVKITEELTLYPLGYICTCKKA